jgi:hypothetical protein
MPEGADGPDVAGGPGVTREPGVAALAVVVIKISAPLAASDASAHAIARHVRAGPGPRELIGGAFAARRAQPTVHGGVSIATARR